MVINMYTSDMSKSILDALIANHEQSKPFKASEILIAGADCDHWVRFKTDPQRFEPGIFDGDWAHIKQQPSEGKLRVIRIMTGNDGISRVIARQGSNLYAYPWFK